MNDNNLYRRRRGEEEEGEERFVMLRQVLNLLFMVGAVAGILVYIYHSHQWGTAVILTSMVFKFAECVFRLMK